MKPVAATTTTPPKLPGLLMGLGLGGFVDGIVLHQILQWHHMLTDTADNPADTLAGLEANTVADGFFHLATWVFVAVAMVLGIRAWQRRELAPPWRVQIGMLLTGWGAFNLVEGLIDHHLLELHHVREASGNRLAWDLAFLALGCLLIVGGQLLARSGEKHARQDARAASASRR